MVIGVFILPFLLPVFLKNTTFIINKTPPPPTHTPKRKLLHFNRAFDKDDHPFLSLLCATNGNRNGGYWYQTQTSVSLRIYKKNGIYGTKVKAMITEKMFISWQEWKLDNQNVHTAHHQEAECGDAMQNQSVSSLDVLEIIQMLPKHLTGT